MVYVSVQPDIAYFHWQVELYLFNFLKVGIKPNDIHVIIMYHSSTPSEEAMQLQKRHPNVRFFFYPDDRPDKKYIPSIKPWGMYKHFSSRSFLEGVQFFYHDSDIIFREKIDTSLFQENKWYLSDTVSYIGYEYCLSKGEDQLKRMAETVGVPIETIKQNQLSSGGGQYIFKSASAEYWLKVYKDSNKLYWLMDEESKEWKGDKDYPIQKWCAEMWATLWNIWYFGHETEVHKELDFSFATAPVEDWSKNKILHNAGVTEKEQDKMFFKGAFVRELPYFKDFSYIDDKFCSSKYVETIQEFAKTIQK
jgi:hypothetical protein